MAAGQFRQDLYWRINVITLELPPLRARRDDLPVLIRHFLDLAAEETGRGRLSLAPEVETRLVNYEYPGNLRELENILRRAAILANGSRIELQDLPLSVSGAQDRADPVPTTNAELKRAKARPPPPPPKQSSSASWSSFCGRAEAASPLLHAGSA